MIPEGDACTVGKGCFPALQLSREAVFVVTAELAVPMLSMELSPVPYPYLRNYFALQLYLLLS